MWKCIGLLLFLGQWIIVTSESNETPGIRNARNTECCPCPEGRSADLTASGTTHVLDDCPCRARSAEPDTATSIFTPIFRSVQPSSRQQQKDLKHLLEPEVDLASSVLETLREATEEEYREALVRDAARSAVQDDINKLVKIVVRPEADDADAEPEASNSHSIPCVAPSDNKPLGRSSLNFPNVDLRNIQHRPLLGRTDDIIQEAANNLQRNFDISRSAQFSENLKYKRPSQNVFKMPVYERDLFVSPSNNLGRSTYDYEELPVAPILPLGKNSILKQLDLRNILNLDRVPSLVPEDILNKKNIVSDNTQYPQINYPERISDISSAESTNPEKCIDNTLDGSEGAVETKILNILPMQRGNEIQSKSSENQDIFDDDTFIKSDGIVEESRDSTNRLISPDNYSYKFLSSPWKSEGTQLASEKSSPQAREMPLIKESILKSLDDFRQANAAIHDNLKSNLDNVLQLNLPRTASENDDSKLVQNDSYNSEAKINNAVVSENQSNIAPTQTSYKDTSLNTNERNALALDELLNPNKKISSLHSNQDRSLGKANSERESEMSQQNENTDTCLLYASDQPKNANNDETEMNMAASDSLNRRYGLSRIPQTSSTLNKAQNSLNMQTPKKTIEDINLDIFDYYQPPSLDQGAARNSIDTLPRLNMKSYKAKVPIPQSIDLKPVKLQKAFRKGNDLLGAILTIKPHSEQGRNSMLSSQSRNSHNIFEHPLGLPSFDDIRSFIEHNAKNILKLPHLSRNVGTNFATPLLNIENAAGNIRTYTEDALKNVQQTLGDTLHNVRDREQTIIGDALLNPNGLVDSLSRNNFDVNDKLHDLHTNLYDRLQSIFDQSRSTSNLHPIRYTLNSKNVPTRKLINTDQKLLNNRLLETRPISRVPINKESNILHRKLNPKVSTQGQKVSDNLRNTFPMRKVDKPITLEKARFDSNPKIQKLFQPKESKSFSTLPKKATILETLASKKPLLPILDRRLANPTLPRNAERNPLSRSSIREQKFSPSENVYRTALAEEPKGIETPKSSMLPTALKKTLLPNIAGNSFLSKVKEAVNKDNNRSIGTQNDVVPSPSEMVRSEAQKENIAFNCKMVCDKA